MMQAVRVKIAFNGYAVGDIITDPALVERLPQTHGAFVETGFVSEDGFILNRGG